MNITVMRMRYAFYCVFNRNPYKHADWLRKHKVFAAIGEQVRFGPWFIPSDARMITLHNNVTIASGVQMMCHDTVNIVINQLQDNPYLGKGEELANLMAPIEIFDNVFVGDGSIICAGTHIGPNVVVSAGSVILKDVPPDSVVRGNPAKVVGKFSVLARMRALKWMKEGEPNGQ